MPAMPLPDPAPASPSGPAARAARSGARLRAALGGHGLLAAVWVVVHLLWLVLDVGGPARRQVVGDLLLAPIFGGIALVAWAAGRNAALPARTRHGWRWLAASYAVLWLANLAWTSRNFAPAAVWLDDAGRALVLASYVPMFVGLFSFPSERPAARQRLSIALDLATVMLAVALAMWQFAVLPVMTRIGATIDRSELLALAQPVCDFAVLAALAMVARRRADIGSDASLRLLAAGHVLSIAGGVLIIVVYSLLTPPARRWEDVLWVLSDALIFCAAALQARRVGPPATDADDAASTRPALSAHDPLGFLPAVGVALGSVLLLVVTRPSLGTPNGVVVVGSIAISCLVLARQVRTLRDYRRAQAELAASETRYRAVVDQLDVVVFRLNARLEWSFLNRAGLELLQGDAVAPRAGSALERVHEDDRADAAALFGALVSGARDEWYGELRLRTRDGLRWFTCRVRATHADDGSFVECAGTLADATERMSREAQLRHRAAHDALTGLPNRHTFEERVEAAIADVAQGDARVAVLFLDLDGFKPVNDELGHEAGDRLLVAVAARLRHATRAGDLVARFGGDEFAVLLQGVTPGVEARRVADRIAAALAEPFQLGGDVRAIGASIGIAEGGAGIASIALLREADAAMYRMKRSRRDAQADAPVALTPA